MRSIIAGSVLVAMLSGCGTNFPQARQVAWEECKAKYPDGSPYVNSNRFRCARERVDHLYQGPFADIYKVDAAEKIEVLVKQDQGAITEQEADRQIASVETRTAREISHRIGVIEQNYADRRARQPPDVVIIQRPAEAPAYQPLPQSPPPAMTPSCADGYACAGRTLQGDGSWH